MRTKLEALFNPDQSNILVVDDTEASRYTVARHLRHAGYHVTEAASGEDALREAKNWPDLVILDVKLPDMSGYEISRMLRLDPGTRSIPILQVSATFTCSSDKVRGLDAGADGYLTAPIDPEELLANVRMLLRLKQTQDALAQTNEQLQGKVRELESAKNELAEAHHALSRQNEELEQRVRERTAKLQESLHELEIFSYNITHDMRAPLRSMQGFANLLVQQYQDKLGSEGLDYLRRIAASANRLDMLIRDVLSYSSVVRNRPNLKPIQPEPLLRQIIRDYPVLQDARADLKIRIPLPPVMGNEALLTICFSNLLDNAVKFVPADAQPRIEVFAETRDSVVRIHFRDYGIGIRSEYHDRLFDLFQRVRTDYPGTGTGLAVVRKAVERMGGRVGLESLEGEGSTFWLELPQVPESEADATQEPAAGVLSPAPR